MQRTSTQLPSSFWQLSRLLALGAMLGAGVQLQAEDVLLSWSDNSDNEDGFNIERAIGDGAFEAIAQVGTDIANYTDSTAQPGVDYRYRVNAFNAFGASGYTNVASHYINVAPALTAIADVAVEENQAAEAIAFTVSDFETPGGELVVSVASSNPALIDAAGMSVQGAGGEKTLSLTPNLNASGESTISVTVSDGADSASADFLFSVNAFLFPALDLAIDSIAAQPRAGEAFIVQTAASDPSVVSSVGYWLGAELLETVAVAPYEAALSVPEAGSYTLSAVANIVGRQETVRVDRLIEVAEAPASSELVDNLATLSVDDASTNGSASYDLATDTFVLEDEGGEISGSSDSHRYYYLRAQGDMAIEAQLSSIESAASGSVAGLMVRSALYGKSPQASLLLDGSGSLNVRTRAAKAAGTQDRVVLGSPAAMPWLRIEKSGSSLSYYTKATAGAAWTLLGSDTLDLGAEVFLGFALAGGAADGIVTATFTGAGIEGEILAMGADAVKPNIPSGLLISSLAK